MFKEWNSPFATAHFRPFGMHPGRYSPLGRYSLGNRRPSRPRRPPMTGGPSLRPHKYRKSPERWRDGYSTSPLVLDLNWFLTQTNWRDACWPGVERKIGIHPNRTAPDWCSPKAQPPPPSHASRQPHALILRMAQFPFFFIAPTRGQQQIHPGRPSFTAGFALPISQLYTGFRPPCQGGQAAGWAVASHFAVSLSTMGADGKRPPRHG